MELQNVNTTKRFGVQEIKLLFELEQSKKPVFTFSDAKKMLGTSDASVKNVLKRLKKKRRIISLQKGVYLFAPMRSGEGGLWSENALCVVPYLVKETYYVGFGAAMNYWGMTEQLPYAIYVALKRQKRALEAVQTRFVFVKKRKIGDFVTVSVGGTDVNISSVEQTILDGLAFPEYCLGMAGVAKAIGYVKDRVDWRKLIRMAKEDKSVVQRRLGFLLELMGFKQSKELESKYAGFSWLDPNAQKQKFGYSKKWGLKVNVEKSDLLEFESGY